MLIILPYYAILALMRKVWIIDFPLVLMGSNDGESLGNPLMLHDINYMASIMAPNVPYGLLEWLIKLEAI